MIKISKIPSWYVIKSDEEDFSGTEGLTELVAQVRSYISNMVGYGKSVSLNTAGGYTSAELNGQAQSDFKLKHFLLVSDVIGGEVEYYIPYIKIADADMSNEVPEGLPNRLVPATYDEEGVELTPERVKTWTEWVQTNYTITTIEGYSYFRSNAGNYQGKSLTSSELLIIHNSTDAELVDSLPVIEE